MDTKKLEKWANLLLDTGKRNNLINFKDTKVSSVEVLLPSSEELLSKAESSSSFEVYDPKIVDDEDEEYRNTLEENGENNTDSGKQDRESYLQRYRSKVKKNNQILLFNANVSPINAIKNISKKAQVYLEETGNNVAYMAFGFVHWKESENSNMIYRAPILLLPITFRNDSAIEPWYIEFTGDDLVVNPTFNYKLQNEHGFFLPDYSDETFSEYLAKISEIVSRVGWSVSAECKIGIFSFLKLNMFVDFIKNRESILKNNIVRMLLGESYDSSSSFDPESDDYHLENPLIELHNVVDADSSQIDAIEMVKAGADLVLQGPPGTGKSQTITNIIAECLYDGKKVLFVSEKQAALNVVYDKLTKAGLDEFCLELHSYKANKKEVIDNLCKTLRAPKTVVSEKADNALELKEKCRKRLDQYVEELHRPNDVINCSLYKLYDYYAENEIDREIKMMIPQIETKDESYLKKAVDLLEQYVGFVPTIGSDYHENCWFGYNSQDSSYESVERTKDVISKLSDSIVALSECRDDCINTLGVKSRSIDDIRSSVDFIDIITQSDLITPAFFDSKNNENLCEKIERMSKHASIIIETRKFIDESFDKEIYEIDFDQNYKLLTRVYNSLFKRLFSAEYKRIIQSIKLCNSKGDRITYAYAVNLLTKLEELQESEKNYRDIETEISKCLGSAYNGLESDWTTINSDVRGIKAYTTGRDDLNNLARFSMEEYKTAVSKMEGYSEKVRSIISGIGEPCEYISNVFDGELKDIANADFDIVSRKICGCHSNEGKLENWCRFYDLLCQIDDHGLREYVDVAIEVKLPVNDIVKGYKRIFYKQWIEYIIHQSKTLMSFNRVAQDKDVRDFVTQEKKQFDISKAQIRSQLAVKRPSLDLIAPGSAVAMILREGEKKRKQKSVRSLLTEAGDLIQLIKPCFLMSPLSVSTFLTSNDIQFDVVIFDEASQIFPQDAIGAIYRGKQLIVVGDSKQMPPSNFFNSMAENEMDDDEEVGDVTDFESILDLCSTSMTQRRLRWHYRSKYEELIAFSNREFYDNDLITFPSSESNKSGVGVDYCHVDGVYERNSRVNRKEAEYIVDLIYKNIDEYPNRSLGVVAFNVSQQDLIERLLSRRRQEDPSKEFFFRKDVPEPFFIKNLETVQGDERDTIIFSIAYAKDSTGRFLLNFGPLNRVGGGRRLNVAVTRAKVNVQLVTSIHATDIDLSRTNSDGARLLREYLDYAENGEIALERAISVNAYEQFDSPFEEEVCTFLKNNGYEVDTQVGCSSFKIDLGVKNPGTSDYVLAIECDGASYHSSKNARDRDRLRQEILEGMGWRFYRIWSTDWFKNNVVEKERLLETVKKAISTPKKEIAEERKMDQEETGGQELTSAQNVFENEVKQQHLAFPKYTKVSDASLYNSRTLLELVKKIVEVESPISEEWLLKRIVWFFGSKRVTASVQKSYESRMYNCESNGIIRRNGFLYLKGQTKCMLRTPVDQDTRRDIKYVSPEEIANGMYVFLKQNITVEKDGLYKAVANALGIHRVTDNVIYRCDQGLALLGKYVEISGTSVSLRDN